MVCISHIYKFIYLKNYKVAGSSVNSFFGQFCIDPLNKKNYVFQDKQEEEISIYGIIGARIYLPKTVWCRHINAFDIKKEVGSDIFNNYFKFCVVRNPYDLMVSSFFWDRKKIIYNEELLKKDFLTDDFSFIDVDINYDIKKEFKNYCINFIHSYTSNNLSRILLDDIPVCNYYIKYENLKNDIIIVLDKLGIKEYNIDDLPFIKSKIRPTQLNYSYRDYYDDESKEIVSKLFQKELIMFNYCF